MQFCHIVVRAQKKDRKRLFLQKGTESAAVQKKKTVNQSKKNPPNRLRLR